MENKFTPRQPDYKGWLEIAGWIQQDENGKAEIKVKLGNSATLKKHIPKPKIIEPQL